MAIYLSPRSDITFKKVFGNDNYKHITIKFLNSILNLKDGKQIEEISFADTANVRESISKKDTFIDVHCIDKTGSHFLIEMQVNSQSYFIARALYYLALTFSRQLPYGVNYNKLVPVICITILDHIKFNQHNNVISQYIFTDTKTKEALIEDYLELYFVELPKFNKTLDQLENDTDKWLFFMKQAETLHAVPKNMEQSIELHDAFHMLNKMTWSDDEFDAYIAQLDEADKPNRIIQAKIEENTEEIAINLLNLEVSVDKIIAATGLSEKQIQQLKHRIK